MKYIYGLNKSGLSLINYFENNKEVFAVWDDDEEKRNSISLNNKKIIFKEPNKLDFSKIEDVYITPGINFNNKNLDLLHKNKITLYRDLELYSKLLSNQKIIAVTGTNGKSTTTKLIGDIIKSNGHNCFLGGNIGKPLIDFKNFQDNSNYHVIELSSFQLESAPSFNSYISILLNISPDHLDRYGTIGKYGSQKKKILNNNNKNYNIISVDDVYCQKIYNSSKNLNNIPISILKPIRKGVYFFNNAIHDNYFFSDKVVSFNKISQSLSGNFNLQNILAAYVVSQILKLDIKKFLNTVSTFMGLPHRLEKIFENSKLLVINNSKATNLNSTINSISNFKNIYLIIGGRIKEKNFSSIASFKKSILKCYIIGESSNFIYKQLSNLIDSKKTYNLENATKEIFSDLRDSKSKSTILLSPGCSSFDQFNNFEHRGNLFREIITNEIGNLE